MEDKQKLTRQLQLKYESSESFRKIMEDREKIYKRGKNALKKHEDLGISDQILQIFTFDQQHEIFFYYGLMQPKGKAEIIKLTLFLIKNFQPHPDKKYTFVFFNNCVDSSQVYYDFKNIFLTLPISFFLPLDQFIFVKPYFSHRIRQWWAVDQIEKFFKAKTRFISSLLDLCPILNTNTQRLTEALPKLIINEQFPQLKNKVIKKIKQRTDCRFNFKGQQRTLQEKNEFSSFIENVMSFFNKSNKQSLALEEYECNEAQLPLILEELFDYFQEKPQKIKEEGLFRKSVSIDEEAEVFEKLIKGNYQCLKEIQNCHIIASLIKRFFAKLKIPIFPFISFNKLMHDQGISDRVKFINQQIQKLPQRNYICLMFLFQFLVLKILPFQKFTKMDARNLSICFAPCLLWSQNPSELDLIYATKSTQIVKIIFDNFQQIFGIQAKRKEKVRSTVRMSRQKWQHQLKQEIQNLNQNHIQLETRLIAK